MRRLDVLVNALSELTGRDRDAVAQTFDAILAANPDKGKDMLIAPAATSLALEKAAAIQTIPSSNSSSSRA